MEVGHVVDLGPLDIVKSVDDHATDEVQEDDIDQGVVARNIGRGGADIRWSLKVLHRGMLYIIAASRRTAFLISKTFSFLAIKQLQE